MVVSRSQTAVAVLKPCICNINFALLTIALRQQQGTLRKEFYSSAGAFRQIRCCYNYGLGLGGIQWRFVIVFGFKL